MFIGLCRTTLLFTLKYSYYPEMMLYLVSTLTIKVYRYRYCMQVTLYPSCPILIIQAAGR